MPTKPPVFDQYNLVVSNMDASVAFYRRMGLTIADYDALWDQHHRNTGTGEGPDFDLDSQSFAGKWNQAWKDGTGGAAGFIGFKCATRDDVDEIYNDLISAGYTGMQAPYDVFFGARLAIVADPDGNAVGLMSPRDEAHQAPAPDPR